MLNKAPTKYAIGQLITKLTGMPTAMNGVHDTVEINGDWHPARPEGYFSITQRIKYAWMVFTGKADIVTWPGGQ